MQSVSYQPSAHLDSNTATGGLLGEETEIQMRQQPFKNEIGEIQSKQSASISINQHQSASVSIKQDQSASVSIRQHQSASINISNY